MEKTRQAPFIEESLSINERCTCLPPGYQENGTRFGGGDQEMAADIVPISPTLHNVLQRVLANHFPRRTPFSLLLLHVAQFPTPSMPASSSTLPQKRPCHAPASFLHQLVNPIRRSLGGSDLALLDERGSGAVFLFPQVNQVGLAGIIERVSYSIHLLQAETVEPPLREQTEIVLGSASYPTPATSPAELLAHAGQVRERIIFRPAVLLEAYTLPARPSRSRHTGKNKTGTHQRTHHHQPVIPFMQIPSRLPTRLKQLIPHDLALKLRCAPVGRDHNRLTVAMANPADTQALCRLSEITGMTIFPVSCEPSALEILLTNNW